jgi:hypothetical protein
MTKFGDAPIKREGDIVDPDECTWECDCEKCQAKYQKWKAAYDDKGIGEHMTGFKSKQAAAQAKLTDDDDIQDYVRPWVGLTDEELLGCAVFKHFDYDPPYINKDGVKFVASHEVSLRATYEKIEQALKEKNT